VAARRAPPRDSRRAGDHGDRGEPAITAGRDASAGAIKTLAGGDLVAVHARRCGGRARHGHSCAAIACGWRLRRGRGACSLRAIACTQSHRSAGHAGGDRARLGRARVAHRGAGLACHLCGVRFHGLARGRSVLHPSVDVRPVGGRRTSIAHESRACSRWPHCCYPRPRHPASRHHRCCLSPRSARGPARSPCTGD